MSNIFNKRFSYSSLIFIVLLISFPCFSQNKILGRVYDSDTKKPIENVCIIKKGSVEGTYSNSYGFFELTLFSADSIIIASHLNFELSEVRIPNSDKFVFFLERYRTPLPLLDIRHFREEIRYDIDSSNFHESDLDSNAFFGPLEINAEFIGGNEGLFNYFGDNFNLSESAKDSLVEGTITIFFTVDKNGFTKNISVFGDTLFCMGDMMIKSVSQMPKWKPARQCGKPVEQDFQVDVKFSNEIYTVVEDPAQYPGGMDEFLKYVKENIKYPEEARVNNIKGTIYVHFTVNRKGVIIPSSIMVLNPMGYGLDEEAIRIVKNSSPWLPARQRGTAIALNVNVPIIFK